LVDKKERARIKQCEATQRWRKNHPEKAKAQLQRYYKTDKYKDQKRNYRYLKMYGISLDAYNELLQKQHGVCGICKQPEIAIDNRTNQPRNLAVDHCHATGQVRGLLCTNCNNMLGRSKDNVVILANAIDYLKSYMES